jgi:peptidoglycan hydrolase CwlO-like protein
MVDPFRHMLDAAMAEWRDEVRARLTLVTQLMQDYNQKVIELMSGYDAALTDLRNQISNNNDAVQSAIILINGFNQRLEQAGNDPEAIQALTQQLRAETNALAQAVANNTPAQTATAPAAPGTPEGAPQGDTQGDQTGSAEGAQPADNGGAADGSAPAA